jgi:hypothetical protein
MPDLETVRLIAHTNLPSAEIIILDGNLQFVIRGVGTLDVALAPGLYTVQYKAGSAVQEQVVALRPHSGTVEIHSPELRMWSPAPLTGNEAGLRFGEFARQCSNEVHQTIAKGGGLFVFLRMATDQVTDAGIDNVLFNVRLLDSDAKLLADLSTSGKKAPDGACLGCNLELAPGSYTLRFDAGDSGLLEQNFVVSEGWQTQVFASSRTFGEERRVLGPNLPEAAVFLARQGRGFDPSEREAIGTESARQGLAERRRVAPKEEFQTAVTSAQQMGQYMPEDQLDEMLKMKFVNPMLGVYGAHLMMLETDPDWDLLREVVGNLKRLVGNHPDVIALTMRPELKMLTESIVYAVPPMLRSSWQLVLAESANRPELVPVASYSASVANRTWGSGAWLVWRSPDPQPVRQQLPASAEQPTATDLVTAIQILQKYLLTNIKTIGWPTFIQSVSRDQTLTDTERVVLLYSGTAIVQATNMLQQVRSNSGVIEKVLSRFSNILARFDWLPGLLAVKLDPSITSGVTQDRLNGALGVPAASLNQAIISLANKLSGKARADVDQAVRGPASG